MYYFPPPAFNSVNGKFDVALEVLQLCLKLLSAANRDELYRLLSFMSLAADPQHIRLHKEVRRTCKTHFHIWVNVDGAFFNSHTSFMDSNYHFKSFHVHNMQIADKYWLIG